MSYTGMIFDRLSRHVADRADHAARVAFGPACEQWLSSEAFAVLNWPPTAIPAGTFVLCECAKRDITLFEGDERNPTALATIEAKVVHPNANLETQLATLRQQLDAAARPDETPTTERGAIAYAVWVDYHSRRDTRRECDFHAITDATFRTLFEREAHDIEPAEGLRPIIARRSISWLGATYQVSVCGVCAVRRLGRVT
jgi:hypothetical protein